MLTFRRLIALFFASFLLIMPATSHAAVDVTITATIAPPPLPVYVQPVIPGPGYIWAPGYWAWGPEGYYWVPGTWVLPPAVGLLWTPGYWAWADGAYLWHAGYWGPRVGFYGGINYGFGYIGTGYFGGYWDHDRFRYNRAVNNFGNVHITNVYNQTVVNNVNITRNSNVTRTSFNGGSGGINARPSAVELQAAQERHVGPTALQTRHEQSASTNRALFANNNHGKPSIAATPRPAAFTARGTVGARDSGPRNTQQNASAPGTARPPHHQQAQPGFAAQPGSAPRGDQHHDRGPGPAAAQGGSAPRPHGGPHGMPAQGPQPGPAAAQSGPHGGEGPHGEGGHGGGGHQDRGGGGDEHGHGPH